MTNDTSTIAQLQHQLFHEIYVLLDAGDRRTLATLQLSPMEFAVLRRLDLSVGRRLTDVGAELLCVKSTITRLVDRLEAAGLAQRLPDPTDRRAQRVILTAQGASIRKRALDLHQEAISRRLELLAPHEQHVLHTLLKKLRTGLQTSLESS